MLEYKVGGQYPYPEHIKNTESCLLTTNSELFDLVYTMPSPPKPDIVAWRKGTLKYGIFIKEAIPFFIVDFPAEQWNFDASMNFHKVNEAGREDWLDTEANIVTLYLVSTQGVIKAMRTISIDLTAANLLKDACEEQLSLYESQQAVTRKIEEISSRFTTANMMQLTQMFRK